MKSTLMIKDLCVSAALDRKAMSAIRGGVNNQANGTGQSNFLAAFAPVSVANGAMFTGTGPVIIQVDSDVDQSATNTNTSENYQSAFGWFFDL